MIIHPNFKRDSPERTLPWRVTEYEGEKEGRTEGRYYNLIKHPECISELEDFKEFIDRDSVQRFFEFLRWISGPESLLETDDCAFRPPAPHQDVMFRHKLRISGRVELFRREHIYNTTKEEKAFFWVARMLCFYLQLTHPSFYDAIVEVKIKDTVFLDLPPNIQQGYRISLNYYTYGDTENGTFESHLTVIDGIFEATKRLNLAMTATVPEFP